MVMQLELFNKPHKKEKNIFLQAVPMEALHKQEEQLLNQRLISQNGMLWLRQNMTKAYYSGDWETYLQLIRGEIDIKKGIETFSGILKNHAIKQMVRGAKTRSNQATRNS